MKKIVQIVVVLTALAVAMVGLQSPASAVGAPAKTAPTSAVVSTVTAEKPAPVIGAGKAGLRKKMDIDFGWYSATVKYSKSETQRIVATNGACSVVIGKAPGWVANVLSGSCGLIAVWAGYALARGKCVGVKVAYLGAVPYDWFTYDC